MTSTVYAVDDDVDYEQIDIETEAENKGENGELEDLLIGNYGNNAIENEQIKEEESGVRKKLFLKTNN